MEKGGTAMIGIALYQHSVGDFKVAYTDHLGDHQEQHFAFDLGGAISFVLGLMAAAHQRGEKVKLNVSLDHPRVNRGFAAGYASNGGLGSLPAEKMSGYESHYRNQHFSKGEESNELARNVEALLISLSSHPS